ncbi:Six-hairpin glycosidase [Glarea lozoyensis ATCC 20868]|uniref:Six-hairpin glycosidase n=1 Tax=Glarea lozoyensis (strain ATCC 20868 / MF5171) TaxID=1116229 RepID=S3DB13_GLAL2|nr:Six-hairpin glycosidase [Glarea lozoyensis ATCC 20868]EPE34274.1 Six-hairpin glycosidase [Glarea lozoyensis ATCC 20868]
MEIRDKNQTKSLLPFKFDSFPLGSIHSSGWLKDQLELSANGLGGHLFDFYRYVSRSTWLGGTFEYSELHESAPYWFNYIVPLAWTLDDQRLKDQARYFLDYVLEHQAQDGWLGPETTRQTRGIWARSLLCFGLTQYAEADPSQTTRIVDAMHKFVALTHSMLQNNFTGLIQQKSEADNFDPYGFGLSRTHELPVSLMWLYEHYPRDNSQMILETIDLLFEGGKQGGRDWTTFFVEGVFPKQGTGTFKTSGFTHGVNLAQGLRYPTVLYRITGNESLPKQTRDAVDMTAKYQTSLSGTIIGDEHLGALSPQRGSELCMAVESMFSYAYLYRFYGSNDFADRAERAAFNALPAAISPDWWSHQYVTQTNQPWARNLTSVNPFFNVVTYANTFGLEPNFPCCTVNHPQAYPKYVASAYANDGRDGVVHMLLGPTILETVINGKNWIATPNTRYSITSGTNFNFAVRIPDWATTSLNKSSIQIRRGKQVPLAPDSSSLQRTSIKKGTTEIVITLPMEIHIETRNQTVGVYYGPLLYAADIEYNETAHRALNWTDRTPLDDSEVDPRAKDHILTPVSDWQFAIDPSTVAVEETGSESKALPNPVFARDGPPTALSVNAYPIEWPVEKDTAALPPINPIVDASKKMKLKLIPFGAAKLHIAQFPVVMFPS